MSKADIAYAFLINWALGSAWMCTGFLPRGKGGWLKVETMFPEWRWLGCTVIVVFYGAIWELIFVKIVWTTIIKGKEYTDL